MDKRITTVLRPVKNCGSLTGVNYSYTVASMKYGQRLKAARENMCLTQAELAKEIEGACTQENISKLERGNATGSEFTLLFARACDVNPLWLATGEGEMRQATPAYPPDLQFIIDAWGQLTPTAQHSIASLVEGLIHPEHVPQQTSGLTKADWERQQAARRVEKKKG